MNGFLLLFLIPLGAAALASVFQGDDDDTPATPEPEPSAPTEGDDQLTNPEGSSGYVDGLGGDDRIELTGVEDHATVFTGDGGYFWSPSHDQGGSWNTEYGPYPPGGVDGLFVGRGGTGNDTLIGHGEGLDLGGDEGNDLLILHPDGAPQHPWPRDAVLRGGAGDDTLRAEGNGGYLLGGDGDDVIHLSGQHYDVDGGAGADRIVLHGVTDSMIHLDRDDRLFGRGDDDDGNTFHLGTGMDFRGNAGADRLYVDPGTRADGGAGNDYLRTNLYRTDSEEGSTLLGGAGNDTLIGNFSVADVAMTAQDRFEWHIGSTNDRLDGGDGNDLIRFDLADTVTGGAGADTLDGFVQAGHTSIVTDFTAGEDWLRINCRPEDLGATTGPGTNDLAHLGIVEQDGTTEIRLGGETVLRLEGATGLRFGLEVSQFQGDTETYYTDFAGNPVARGDLDVVINPFERFIA
ncbi:calcium-binding protein [Paracoccus aminophilus]|nr:hypothetical protein [Paracoccus aminophilus]